MGTHGTLFSVYVSMFSYVLQVKLPFLGEDICDLM